MWLQIVLDLLSTLFVLFFFWKYQVITFPDKGETTESEEQDKNRKISKKNGIIAVFVLILSCLFYGFLMRQEPEWITLLRFALMYAITFAAAGIDHISQKIPNSLIGIGLIGGTAVLIVQLFENPGNRQEIALGSLAGLIGSLIFMWILALLTKHGIGYGDVKLFAVIGYLAGLRYAYGILFYAALFAAGYGGALLLLKKAGKQQKMAFAPFIFAGMYLICAFAG